MKAKLTPELSYLIGLWKARRTSEGIGISGNEKICGIFLEQALKLNLAEPGKVQIKETWSEPVKSEGGTGEGKTGVTVPKEERKMSGMKVFFYHSAYRAFFDSVIEERLERFKYKNEFSANYLAGMFDGCGGIGKKEKDLFFEQGDREDEMLLLRLGFRVKKVGRRIMVLEKEKFLGFVKPHLKFFS